MDHFVGLIRLDGAGQIHLPEEPLRRQDDDEEWLIPLTVHSQAQGDAFVIPGSQQKRMVVVKIYYILYSLPTYSYAAS